MRFSSTTVVALISTSATASPLLNVVTGLLGGVGNTPKAPTVNLPPVVSGALTGPRIVTGLKDIAAKAEEVQKCIGTSGILDGVLNNVGKGSLPEIQQAVQQVTSTANQLLVQLPTAPDLTGSHATNVVNGVRNVVDRVTNSLNDLAGASGLSQIVPIIGTPIVEQLTQQQATFVELIADIVDIVPTAQDKPLADLTKTLCAAYANAAKAFGGVVPLPINLQNLLNNGLGGGLFSGLGQLLNNGLIGQGCTPSNPNCKAKRFAA